MIGLAFLLKQLSFGGGKITNPCNWISLCWSGNRVGSAAAIAAACITYTLWFPLPLFIPFFMAMIFIFCIIDTSIVSFTLFRWFRGKGLFYCDFFNFRLYLNLC